MTTKTNRRNFLRRGAAAAGVTAVGLAATDASAQTSAKKVLKTGNGIYSGTIGYGNLIFLSGAGYQQASTDVKVHTKAVLDGIEADLKAAGSSMEKVLKVNVYLTDIKNFDAMNEMYRGRFGADPPTRTTVAVAALPGKSLVEIEVMAYV